MSGNQDARGFLARAVAYLKNEGLVGAQGGTTLPIADQPVLLPMGSGLVVAYVVDEPEGLVYVQQRHLEQGGMSAMQLHDSAMSNLGRMCAEQIRLEKHGPVFGVFLEGNFEASLFLLKTLWQRDLAHLVENGFAVAVPARDIMAFCDIDSAEGIATLKQMIERVHANGDHLISKNIFRIPKATAN